jgi:hypothetical protein
MRVLLARLAAAQLVKKFFVFYGHRRFITTFVCEELHHRSPS